MLSKLFSLLFVFKPKKCACNVMTRKSSQSYIENEIKIRQRTLNIINDNDKNNDEDFSKYFAHLKGLNVYERKISCHRRIV